MNCRYKLGDKFLGKQTRRAGAVVARSPASWQMVAHPTLMGVVEGMLEYQVANMSRAELKQRLGFFGRSFPTQLNLTQIIHRGAKQENQPLHRDGFAWPPLFHGVMEVEVSTIWASS